jgi:transketolase
VLHFGIREHAMAAILNGIVLHGNTRPFGGTFLIFSDYMRPAVRLAALMKAPSIFVWTHDSVALGEDGPTHQPIEQLASLRAIPGLTSCAPATPTRSLGLEDDPRAPRRPGRHRADPAEHPGVRAWRRRRQTATPLASAKHVAKGAYVLAEAPGGTPDVIFIATGSEVQVAIEARELLKADGDQRSRRLSPEPGVVRGAERRVPRVGAAGSVQGRVSIEAGIDLTWHRYVGDAGRSVSIEHFGASADYQTLFREFGITAEHAVSCSPRSRWQPSDRPTAPRRRPLERRTQQDKEPHEHHQSPRSPLGRRSQHLARRPLA